MAKTFWDRVAYACLFIGAAILAAETGLAQSPTLMQKLPSFFHSEWWGFAPLVLVLIATAIAIARGMGWVGQGFRSPKIVRVRNQRFLNEQVILDGHSFYDCRFENVTFVYNGDTPVDFVGNHIIGRIHIKTENRNALNLGIMLRGLGLLREDIKFLLPPWFTVNPPQRLDGPPPP